MAENLTDKIISETYPGLIKTGDNSQIDSNLKVLSDGDGNELTILASIEGVKFKEGSIVDFTGTTVVGGGGIQGAQGPQGDIGNQGIAGPQGYQGIAGPQGYQGNIGTQGNQGNIGTQGYQGYQGPQGSNASGSGIVAYQDIVSFPYVLKSGQTGEPNIWNSPYTVNGNLSASSPILGKTLIFIPFVANPTQKINELMFQVMTESSSPHLGLISIGVYNSELTTFINSSITYSAIKPANLIVGSNSINSATVGIKKLTNLNTILGTTAENIYWLALYNPNQSTSGNPSLNYQQYTSTGKYCINTIPTTLNLNSTASSMVIWYNNTETFIDITTLPIYINYSIFGIPTTMGTNLSSAALTYSPIIYWK